MRPLLIYCYDAYCGWCYGFREVMMQIQASYIQKTDFEVLSGGMVLPEKPVHISLTASYILTSYKQVESISGASFGGDYLWHIRNPDKSDWFPHSEKPAIALCIFKEYLPGLQVNFASDMQYALYAEGRDLVDDEAYRHLVDRYEVPAAEFFYKLHDASYKEKAYNEFELVMRLKVTGFPALLLQAPDSTLYSICRGYTEFSTVARRIDEVLQQII